MKSDLINVRDVVAYFLVASAGVIVQLLVGSLSQEWFALSFRQSLILGYILASVVGFILTKMFAFSNRSKEKSRREMIKFAMVTLLSFAITVYGSDFLFTISKITFGVYTLTIPFSVKTVNINQLCSQIACMGLSFVSNYTLHKKFTFQNTGFYERLKRLLF
ncbi:GtrA family protein [Dyadobacter luteus]|jgi:putative flippase GtrA|uniref:GtrA family protein n=1 Tax=Dyadobacter luteus TaxID=2259619 RepID=A0A3D8YEE7_9BACT|nr:GtrA family protein [Dyadobacter luteus]REA61246.1 GtrA family protein [Dyadobacter luteus]